MRFPDVRTLGWVLVGLSIAALIVTVVASVLVSANNSEAIRSAQRTNTETLELIRSCTTPGKPCFDEGQKRTGEAVGTINQVSVFAAACADAPKRQSVKEIEACVRDRLEKAAAKEQP